MQCGGLFQSLEKFSTLFGLRLSHRLFSAAEQLSFTLQEKEIALQDAIKAVEAAKSFFKQVRSDEEFDRFYDDTVSSAQEHNINQPELPRYRKRPSRYESGSEQHHYSSPKSYHCHLYFEACDLLYAELGNRFDSQLNSSVLALEQTLIKAANGEDCQSSIKELEKSCYKDDIVWSDLVRHLPLQDVVQKGVPAAKKVTSVHTICEAMNSNDIFKEMIPTVHQLLCLYLTLPITSANLKEHSQH